MYYYYGGGVSWGPNQKWAAIIDWFRMRLFVIWHTITFSHKWGKCGHTNFGSTGIIYHCKCGLEKVE